MLEHKTVSVATDTASYSEKNNTESVNGMMLLSLQNKVFNQFRGIKDFIYI